jgi:uncharacterized phage-associated protein
VVEDDVTGHADRNPRTECSPCSLFRRLSHLVGTLGGMKTAPSARSSRRVPSAHDVAAAIIELGGPVDALKLQKLVFLAAGEYLALTGHVMFDEPIEAWDYGPVVHAVYATYKATEGRESIRTPKKGDRTRLNDVGLGCVESVVHRFGHASGADLIRITHAMDPWADAYKPGTYRTTIDNQAIYEYFAKAPTLEQETEAVSAWNAARSVA